MGSVIVDSKFTVRPAKPNDRLNLEQIVDLSFSRFLGYFAKHSLHDEGQVLVTETETTVVGFAKLIEFYVYEDMFGCVLWVAVHPKFRRKGVASALVEAGTKWLKQEGAKSVFASIQRRNTASLSVFDKQGFRRRGFLDLYRLFSWRVFVFYWAIWLAPGEVVLMHS
jgi:ribosomal protein S18 acetylase RimI-like enzyme